MKRRRLSALYVQKIHACINDNILYRSVYENLMHARYALHCGIRLDEMALVMLRVSAQEEGFSG
jgi:hypothetical protein